MLHIRLRDANHFGSMLFGTCAHTKDAVLHECTSLFCRDLFPAILSTYSWHWPSRAGDDSLDGAIDLTPCQFGWPASRSRCYTVTWPMQPQAKPWALLCSMGSGRGLSVIANCQ